MVAGDDEEEMKVKVTIKKPPPKDPEVKINLARPRLKSNQVKTHLFRLFFFNRLKIIFCSLYFSLYFLLNLA